ncbi:MAG TPA: hypothetical protein VM120_11175 [Bryobacteraceae bacterium]|nr:hypothetical protein [Bryobacteraceae bacterium]
MDWRQEAKELEMRGEVGEAIGLLERKVASGEESAALCKELARLCLMVNEMRAFINWCHEAMRIDTADGEPYLMIGRVLSGKERWAEAVEALEQATTAVLSSADRNDAEILLAAARLHPAQCRSPLQA